MFKNIKKTLKYLIIILETIIIIPVLLYLLIQIPDVQTYIINKIAQQISDKIKSTVSTGHIEYRFFNKLSVNDVLIKDINNDTLLYSKNITVGIKTIHIKNGNFNLGTVDLNHPVIAFVTDSSGVMNLTRFLDLIKNKSDTIKKKKEPFTIENIRITNGRFAFINHSKSEGKTKIDFSNLRITDLNVIVDNFKTGNDTTTFDIKDLGFRESSGFILNKLNSSVLFSKQNIRFESVLLNCDSSTLNIPELSLMADSSDGFKKFNDDVKLNFLFNKSLISTSDLKYFVNIPEGISESAWLSGKISGTISELRGRDIEINYKDYTYLNCDFDLSGLPEFGNTFMYIGVNNLRTNAKDFTQVKDSGGKTLNIPEVLYNLDDLTFTGSFSGFYTDFVTYGIFRSKFGNLRTDISLRPDVSGRYKIKGLLSGNNIDLGKVTKNNELLGNITIHANVDGYAYSLKKFATNLSGTIDSIEVNKYLYKNISMNGFFTENTWDGKINVADRNLKMDLSGLLNFEKKLPEFNFSLNIDNANLYKLNIDKKDSSSSVTAHISSNFKGNNIDNLDGEIKLLDSKIHKFDKDLSLTNFTIKTFNENNKPALNFRTDYIDADIRGYYNFSELGTLFKSTLASLMPSQFHSSKNLHDLQNNNFTFDIRFKNTDDLNNFFRTGILIAENSDVNGEIVPDSIIRIKGNSELISVKNSVFKNFSLNADVKGSGLSVLLTSTSLTLPEKTELKDVAVKLITQPDTMLFSLDWDNKDNNSNKGSFIAKGKIEKNDKNRKFAIIKIDIDSSDVYTNSQRWKVNRSLITVDSSAVDINNLIISNKDRFYLVDGKISESKSDTLNLEFNKIDITPLNYIGKHKRQEDPNKLQLNLKGVVKGRIKIADIYKNIMIQGNMEVNDFSILGYRYGDVSINSVWDVDRKVVSINANDYLGGKKMLDINGTYDPPIKKLDLYTRATGLSIDFLNPLLNSFSSGITGSASGNLHFSSEPGIINLEGSTMIENASMKIDYLQTKYKINDTVRFDKNGIRFNNVRITDQNNNLATLSGSVNHKNFRDFMADLNITINSDGFLVLNTQLKDNQMFYGTAYATGVAKIKSGPDVLAFDIAGRTEKNTKISIPLNTGLSVSEYPFISFVDPHASESTKTGEKIPLPVTEKQTGITLNINLEVTPDAQVEIIFDPKVGDVMKGRGSSDNLNMTLDKNGNFKTLGDYTIETGDYTFTLGNIFNKPFSVENGGKIMFNGDLDNAEIELSATYKNLKASLYALEGDERFKGNERTTVEPQLNLTGKLFNPIVNFNINLPNADEEKKSYLRNAISTEEELNRQVFSLLVMNSFISIGSISPSAATSTGTNAMYSTTFEMLSNQISNWLSQINQDFDVGFVYRPGYDAINTQEVEVALSTQLLNDKVVINSNIDLRETNNSTAGSYGSPKAVTGDFDVEYKITEKLRFKVFNRYNNPYSNAEKAGQYTQGIGFTFKRDFNKLVDLFRRKPKSDMKKEEEPSVKSN
jgi:hypothetical protein